MRHPNRIREYRLRAQITQRALADLFGGQRSMISAWERGRALPSVPNLFRLAKALNTLAEALYGELYSPEAPRESTEPSDRR